VPGSPCLEAIAGGARVGFSSRHATPSSKHETPELPLLEGAAQELASLDEFQLLPAAAIDCCHGPGAWTPPTTTPNTGLPASPDNDDATDSEEEHTESAEEEPHQLRTLPAVSLDPIKTSGCYTEGDYVPMWCWKHSLEDGQVLLVPFAEGVGEEPPIPDIEGYCEKLWCWLQPADAHTGKPAMVVPFTDKAEVEADAAGGSDLLDVALGLSPSLDPDISPRPPKGGHEPAWSCGPCWPFNRRPTTLSVSGLPQDCTQEELLEILDREEFSGLYDFVYLPPADKVQLFDLEAMAGASESWADCEVEKAPAERCALINLTKHTHALALADRLHKKKSWGGASGSCCVDWSLPCQSLAELIQVYRNVPGIRAPEGQEDILPQVFKEGWPVPLPPPTA